MIVGPDSRAQIAIQAAERLLTLGAGVPWAVSPPLPPWLIAALSTIPGVTPESAYAVLAALAFFGSAWAVFRLWRIMGAEVRLALQAAVLALPAPSGWIAILERGEIDRLLFWKLVPFVFLAIDLFRRKPTAWRIGLILLTCLAMALTRSSRIVWFDALALAEWAVLFSLCLPWRPDERKQRLARLAGAAGFALVLAVRLAAAREPGALGPMPAGLVARARKPVVGPVSLEAQLHPALGKLHGLIDSDLRPRESMLWLQALGAESVIAPAHGKFARELQCVAQENGWCVFDTGVAAPPAVLVSRERFETLEPIRGLFDVEGLERYLLWAARPEAVGYERDGKIVRLQADAAPGDLVLVRLFARDWDLQADPIGYSVVEPYQPVVPLRFGGSDTRAEEIHLDDADYPRILPEGVVDAVTYAPPPFQPGAHVSIFGERFRPDASQTLLDGAELPITYLSSTQINTRLPGDIAPGPHALVVNSAGRRSYPYAFEVAAP